MVLFYGSPGKLIQKKIMACSFLCAILCTGTHGCWPNGSCNHRPQQICSSSQLGQEDAWTWNLAKFPPSLAIRTWECAGFHISCLYLVSRQACDQGIPHYLAHLHSERGPQGSFSMYQVGCSSSGTEASTAGRFTRILTPGKLTSFSSCGQVCGIRCTLYLF